MQRKQPVKYIDNMKKLLLLLLLSLAFIGSANASEWYKCKHYWVSISILGDKSNYKPKDFKLKVERKNATIIQYGKENKVFKIDSNMINLIGCSKENFFKLLELMQYKRKKTNESNKEFFSYQPKYETNKQRKIVKKTNKKGPFNKLSELRFR